MSSVAEPDGPPSSSRARAASPARSPHALIDRHPHFRLSAITSRSDAGTPLNALYPHHRVPLVLEELDLDLDHHGEVDAAIVAYPHGAAAPLVAELLEGGIKVVDLSADFRLRDLKVYEEYYVPHAHPELLAEAVYGLPELYRAAIAETDLVAGPGCYPDRRDPDAGAARAGGSHRRRDHRCEVRRQRGGSRRDAEDALCDRRRERRALRRRHATATRRRSTRSWRSSAPTSP